MHKMTQGIKKYFLNGVKIFMMAILLTSHSTLVLAEELIDQQNQNQPEAILEVNVEKYDNYEVHEKQGTILQLGIETGIAYQQQDQQGPMKKSMVVLKMPEINGYLPERIELVKKDTKATNGGDNHQVTQNYYADKGILQIIVNNGEEKKYNEYHADARDRFSVVGIYPKECYTNQEESRELGIKAVVQQETYQEELGSIINQKELNLSVNQKVGEVISSSIQAQDIYNGYINSNIENGTSYETRYQEKTQVEISQKELEDEIWIEQENTLQNEKEQIITIENPILYHSTTISKQELVEILGETGTIKLIKEDGTVLTEINKDTQETSQGVVKVTYEEALTNLKIQLSQPKKEGMISFYHEKAIREEIKDAKISAIGVVQKIISVKNQIELKDGQEQITQDKKEISQTKKGIEVGQAQTKMEVTTNVASLTNETQNEVVFTATLKNDDASKALFKNPTLQITLPEEAEKVVLGDISVLYGEGIKIKEAKVIQNREGQKVIDLSFEGAQNAYMKDDANQETTLLIPATIILKKEMETTKKSIHISYTNQVLTKGSYQTEEKEANKIEIELMNTNQKLEENVNQGEKENLPENNTPNNKVNNSNKNTTSSISQSDLEVTTYAQVGSNKLAQDDKIHDSEIIKYVVSIKNNSDKAIHNVDINCQIPENTVYATVLIGTYLEEDYSYQEDPSKTNYQFSSQTIEPGETKTGFYEVVVKKLPDGITQKQISNQIKVQIEKQDYKEITMNHTLVKSDMNVYLRSYIGRDQKNSFFYYLDVTNTTGKTLTNVAIESNQFQKEISVTDAYYYSEDSDPAENKFGTINQGKLEGVIDRIDPGQTRSILIYVEAQNFDDNVNEVLLSLAITAKPENGDSYRSNENRRNAYPEYVTLKMTSEQEGEEVKAGQEISYQLEIKNMSKIRTKIHVFDYLPKGLQPIFLTYDRYTILNDPAGETTYDIEYEQNIEYSLEKKEIDLSQPMVEKPNIDEYMTIPAGKSVTMTITAKTWDVLETTEVSNYATAQRAMEKENHGIKTVTSNIVKFTLLSAYDNGNTEDPGNNPGTGEDPNNPGGGTIAKANTISGLVWKDANRDGKRDSTEEIMKGNSVTLYNVDSKTLVQKTSTDEQGSYQFKEVKNGNYWVLFEYDTQNYSLTKYQKESVSSDLNSDVISKKVNIDGSQKTVGITDNLTITDNGLAHIDMGLVENKTFDMKLDKYISKVTVNTNKGTKTYEYKDTQFAKIEIKAKEIQGSQISIEYKIKVTNEGDTEGFIGKVADYLPEGFSFNTAANKGWTKDSNGLIVNQSLSSEFIAPGASKELTLVVSKQLTGEETGNLVNGAEILEARNASNLPDKDSTPGNRVKTEDDYSEAQLLLSVETGALTYTIITLIAIGILVLIVLIMKGKIKPWKNKKAKTILKVMLFMGITATLLSSNVYAFNLKWQAGGVYYSGGTPYVCADPGKHLCAPGDHYYDGGSWTDTYTAGQWWNTLKSVQLSKDESKVDTTSLNENYNLVGPYTIRTNSTESSISNIILTYTENGVVKQSTNKNLLTNSSGSTINMNLGQNVNTTFYIKVSTAVEKINGLRIDVTTQNVNQLVTQTNYKVLHGCYSTSGGYSHNNASGLWITASTSGTQRMKTYYEYSTHSYSNQAATSSISYGAVDIKGRIAIVKTDKTTGKPMANIGFTLKMISGQKAGQYVSYDTNGNAVYSTALKTMLTNAQGEINIKLLYQGNYELIETVNPYDGYEKVPIVINAKLSLPPGKKTIVNVQNERKYIKISGFAWEDMPWMIGKEETSNGIYHGQAGDQNDKLLEHVKVQLKDSKGNVIKEVATNQNGEYTLIDVEINHLNEYYIEFVYNGMSYQSVAVKDLMVDFIKQGQATQSGKDGKTTKAIEGENRTQYNGQYASIDPKESRNEKGEKTYDLNYHTTDYTSNINYGNSLQYGYEGAKYPVNGTDAQYLIGSTTYQAYNGYLDKLKTAEEIRKEGITEIQNINLGIEEREQPDLAVIKDLETAKVSINQEDHIYQYADRFNSALYKLYDAEGKSGYDMAPQVKFGQKYSQMSYTRALYPSDIKYTGRNSLETNVTYRIGIKNASTNLDAVVNELADYYDTKYELVAAGTKINEDGSIKEDSKLVTRKETITNKDYQKIIIESKLDVKHQEEGYIFVQLKVKPQNIIDIVDQNKSVKLDNVTEINSYTMKDQEGKLYAGIDIDSQPGNIDLTNPKTFEDDTDKAPGLLLVLQEQRELSGTVFLDNTTGDLKTGEVRQGSGTYENGEKGIENVKVSLINADGTTAKIYNDETKKVEKDAIVTTDSNGNFTIKGFIPGDYKVVYTWGDKTYKVQDYKSTVVNKASWEAKEKSNQWYKDEFKQLYKGIEWNDTTKKEIRTSDAADDYTLRQNIDHQLTEITNGIKDQIANYETGKIGSQELINKMNSSTQSFKINVEYSDGSTNIRDEYETNSDGSLKVENGQAVKKEAFKNYLKSIDFGIVERAKQGLSLDKRIKTAKITLADGSILVNAKINENGQLEEYTKYASYIPKSPAANGQLKIEIDDEIIQSATLEMGYDFAITNISEKEYLSKDFYFYGKGYGDGNESDLVSLTPSKIIDYLDNNISIEIDQNKQWNVANDSQKKDLMTNGYLSESLKQTLKDTGKVMITEELNSKKLRPTQGQDVATVGLKAYRLLSDNDETILENNAEIIQVGRDGGSTLITTPGNYVPADDSTSEEDDAKSESLVILPPTGLMNNIIAYTILTISSLGILVAGVVLIKRYVLKK